MRNAPQRNLLPLVLILTLICAALGVAAWMAAASPALGLTEDIATPTSPQPFAVVRIVKPVITPTALPTSSPIPLILPIDSPAVPLSESTLYAEVIADTPAPGYSNTTPDDPLSVYDGNKYILVDISEQHMYVYEGDILVNNFVSSTGMNNATRAGHFSVLDKIPSAYGETWDIWMPHWLGIYWAGSTENGIHALPILPNGATLWAGYLGVPISYGCVVLDTYEAQWLYDWADIGTPVEIRW